MKTRHVLVAYVKTLSACLVVAGLTGCAVFQQKPDSVILRDTVTTESSPSKLASGALYAREIDDLSKKLEGDLTPEERRITAETLSARKTVAADLRPIHEFAVLSGGIYQGYLDDWRPELFCETGTGGMADWRQITGEFSYDIDVRRPKGFELEIWTLEKNRPVPLVVLVFRGTDFESASDWLSNLRWFVRPFTVDQYDYAMALVPKLVKDIEDRYGGNGNVVVMATGHSLGGGLAQQAGYVSADIKKVYAFAPSPVTGFFSVDRENRQENKAGMSIYRIFEHGEILAYLRWFLKGFVPLDKKDPKIVEGRYNLFGSGNTVTQHNMKTFACELAAIAERARR